MSFGLTWSLSIPPYLSLSHTRKGLFHFCKCINDQEKVVYYYGTQLTVFEGKSLAKGVQSMAMRFMNKPVKSRHLLRAFGACFPVR